MNMVYLINGYVFDFNRIPSWEKKTSFFVFNSFIFNQIRIIFLTKLKRLRTINKTTMYVLLIRSVNFVSNRHNEITLALTRTLPWRIQFIQFTPTGQGTVVKFPLHRTTHSPCATFENILIQLFIAIYCVYFSSLFSQNFLHAAKYAASLH
jgi:hypothetical protein